jgi:peptidoglycan/LPS O-acetylase OafA/YrhL
MISPSMPRRATQIDGLRAISVVAVTCAHWIPKPMYRGIPLELGLFFFLVLSGYLITGMLLRERDRGESTGLPWRAAGMKNFQLRRGIRILAPYYMALALAWLLGVPDVRSSLIWYVTQMTNLHFAVTGWVAYTSHFWSLAAQQQFYVLWPLVIWWVPKRWLAPTMILVALTAPLYRLFSGKLTEILTMPDVLPITSCDYLAIGGLLALAVHRGLRFDHRGLKWAAWSAFAGYAVIYLLGLNGYSLPSTWALKQTLLAIAFCGLIAAASAGFSGWRGYLLDHPAIQHIGRLSYSLYLYHNLAPLCSSMVFPWLWNSSASHPAIIAGRGITMVGLTWLLAWLSWRFIEAPTQRAKVRLAIRPEPTL